MFTDNDELSGLVARMMKAEILVILSNVDGVFTGNPDEPGSELIHDVYPDDDYSGCVSTSKSQYGRGGMMTKMKTALGVAADGIEVRIANGRRQDVLLEVLTDPENARCTRFHASKK
jgi:glutamate 5-kinase